MPSRRMRKAARANGRKDAVVRMRIPAEQKQALVEAAERDGLDLSTWLRQLALRAAGVLTGRREEMVGRAAK